MEEIEIEKHFNQSLNMALAMSGESTNTNSFFVEVKEVGFFIRLPHSCGNCYFNRQRNGITANEHLYQVLPLLISTFYTERGIL
ncbi:hypothetical protein [Bacillus mycoides]|uniref:hypothetical protein n=1 Tax=Bacillus mycoides TaxID=1405 RepID=UPI002E0469A8|nr:hypothetical protein [Bacillus mycoides]